MEQWTFKGCPLCLHGDPSAETWVIQLSGAHEADGLAREIAAIDAQVQGLPYALIVVPVERWNHDLSPWRAPAVFGKDDFGDGAAHTLAFVLDEVLPALHAHWSVTERKRLILAGYSLAGLFALWSGYRSAQFEGIAAVSPSVWFPGWLDMAAAHPPLMKTAYLSLGDKEAKTRNPLMATVADAISAQHALLLADNVHTTLLWNPGNHFRDADLRTAHGIAWVIRQMNGLD